MDSCLLLREHCKLAEAQLCSPVRTNTIHVQVTKLGALRISEVRRDIRDYLNGLQESDYEQPFKRNRVEAAAIQARIKKTLGNLRESLQVIPSAHLEGDTRRS